MDNDIFGISGNALRLCENRAEILTENIVNSSTPHYKARDIDFHKLVKQSSSENGTDNTADHMPLMYRIPMQKSADGNTVDAELERKNFIENAMNYQVNLTFVQNKSEQLMHAIKGE